jgi:hypothetical protein
MNVPAIFPSAPASRPPRPAPVCRQAAVTVARLWPGATVVCIGTGPSLTLADVEACRDRARVIVVNNAYALAPWADVLYAADQKWWSWHKGAPDFAGLKYTIHPTRTPSWPGLLALRNTGAQGLELQPDGLRTGYNSGYQAINLAVHLGASRIVLLGYDMSGDHFFGSHPDKTKPPFAQCLQAFTTLPGPLADAGVEVINCSRQTALTCFPRRPLAEVLP